MGATGFQFLAIGYCVSTAALEEATIEKYIRYQDNPENNWSLIWNS